VDKERTDPYRWVILIVGILSYATSQAARQNYTGIQKFIAADFDLDKAALGVLGSVFFYSYALFQMPWGIAADKFGSRIVTGVGILLTALTMAGFATSGSHAALLFWRGAGGVAGAAAYVAMTGGIARWFPSREQGMSQAALGGVGGALGEATGFFLLPALAVYFVSWRDSANVVAAAIAAMAVVSLIFLRSAPPNQNAVVRVPFTPSMLRDPQLWSCTLLHSACMVGIRISQAWFALYVTDVYVQTRGMSLNEAVVTAGLLATVLYSLLGRGLCTPVLGRISDGLLKRGPSTSLGTGARGRLVIASLVVTVISFQLMAMGVTSIPVLAMLAVLMGLTVNSFTLVIAEASEFYGAEKTGSVSSFMNMVGQLLGATALAVSGYIGVGLNGGAKDSLADYEGIWLSGIAWIVALTVGGSVAYYFAGSLPRGADGRSMAWTDRSTASSSSRH
jgi:nitrate/nitrite transporter NarK